MNLIKMPMLFFCVSLQISISSIAMNPAEDNTAGAREKVAAWLQNRHSPDHVGYDDPHLPAFYKFKPALIPLPVGINLPSDVLRKGKLDLLAITPKFLEEMNLADLENFLTQLGQTYVKIEWSDKDGEVQSGKERKYRAHHRSDWEKGNAAFALALRMATQNEHILFAYLIALAPDAITPCLHGHVAGLLHPHVMAKAISELLLKLEQGCDLDAIPQHISFLVDQGLKYWVYKDINKLHAYMKTFLDKMTEIIERQNPIHREKILGVMIGSIIAGALKRTQDIKRIDEKRNWTIGVVFNLLWAATSFVGVAPITAPIAAGVAGGLAIGTVVAGSLMTALGFPRDFTPDVKTIEGRIKLKFLKADEDKLLAPGFNVGNMLWWLQASINVNGFND